MHSLNKKIPEVPPMTESPSSNCKVKRLIFCRHAETDPNANFQLQGSGINEQLNTKGIGQAEALAERLSSMPNIGVIVTSELKRAIQTSEIIANAYPKKLEILKEKQLAEISWGIWEGVVCPDLKSLIETWISGDFTARAPGGENPLEVRDRILPVIYSLLNRPEENILIVVHGRMLRVLLSSILYGDLAHMQLFNHRNTCVNIIDVLYEPDLGNGEPSSLTKVSSVKSNKGHARTKSPLIRSLSGGGIIISPIPVQMDTTYDIKNSCESSLRFNMPKPDLESENEPGTSETPILDVVVSNKKYKVKFIPKLLDSVEHLTAELY